MRVDGNLIDDAGKAISPDDRYRYERQNSDGGYRYESTDSVELKRIIEEKKRELKELEEKQNRRTSQVPEISEVSSKSTLISRGSFLSFAGTYF
jgi:hypothetical protein